MKKFAATAFVTSLAVLGMAGPASADTFALPYGGTATLTIPDVTLPASGCINHYGTFSTTTPDYWNIDVDYTGPTTWSTSDYLYGTGPQSGRIVEFVMCASSDGPGVYTAGGLMTVESPYTYDQREVIVSDQFVVAHTPPPPPPPPPAPPAPPTPVYADVSGTVVKKPLDSGVRLRFRSNAIPAGATVRNALKWKITYDGRTKKVTQGPNELDTLNLRFKSGRHAIKVFRNGTRVLTTVVRVRG